MPPYGVSHPFTPALHFLKPRPQIAVEVGGVKLRDAVHVELPDVIRPSQSSREVAPEPRRRFGHLGVQFGIATRIGKFLVTDDSTGDNARQYVLVLGRGRSELGPRGGGSR